MNKSRSLPAGLWPLLAAICILLIIVGALEWNVLDDTHGVMAYPVDDTFIHLAIAKNLAFHHIWGIAPDEFCSASSSILYPVLLSGFFLVGGATAALPFWVNLAAGIVFLIVIYRWLAWQEISQTAQFLILLALILLTPLPVLIMTGMEHTLQLLFCALFVYQLSTWLAKSTGTENPKSLNLPWPILLYGLLITAIRYDDIFLAGMGCLLLLWKRRLTAAVTLGFVAALPIFLFGLYSLSKGSLFFPNSVLLKSQAPQLTIPGLTSFFTEDIFAHLTAGNRQFSAVATQRLLFILPLLYLLFLSPIRQAAHYQYILLLLMGCTVIHLSVAATGWFFRYEAYLIGCSIPVSGVLIAKYGIPSLRGTVGPAPWVSAFLLGVLIFPILLRSKDAFAKTCQACRNIYGQQYQMGRFLHDNYKNDGVAINDIGAVSWLTEGKKLDLYGLGSLEVTRFRVNGYVPMALFDTLIRRKDVKVAIIYDRYFGYPIVRNWSKVATWRVSDNYICGDDVISFYSINPADSIRLKENLKRFQAYLPNGVEVSYF